MLSVGLVGLPNAGKSSLFNLLTKRSVPAQNFPFTTIDPHDGVVEVPDSRLQALSDIVSAEKIVPAAIEFKDIAGLIKNAHQGEGLGNQFLSHIQETDMILMVLRCFENKDIIHVEDRVNPQEDFEILMIELTMSDEKKLENILPRLQKEAKKDPHGQAKVSLCEKILEVLNKIEPASSFTMDDTWDEEVVHFRKQLNLLTDKPILRLGNITQGGENVEFNADFKLDILQEAELAEMEKEDRVELGFSEEAGLDGMIRSCFKTLNLATYLTAGVKEVRAWTFVKGMKAPQCAGRIHTDFEKKFIKAEVVSFDDFVANNGWKGCFDKGAVKTMGKEYEFQDGDVTEFKIGG